VDGLEKIGKMFIGVEITQIISNELSETYGDLNVPLLKYVQPKLCVYKLVFFIKIKDKIKLNCHHILLQIICTILGIAPI